GGGEGPGHEQRALLPHSEAGTLLGTRRGAPRRTRGGADDARPAAVGVGCGACTAGCRPRPGRTRRSRPARVDRGAARSIRAVRLLIAGIALECVPAAGGAAVLALLVY